VSLELLAIGVGALALSWLLTAIVRRLVLAHGLLDVPNTRSSHTVATPRGGGLAVVLVTTGGLALTTVLGLSNVPLVLALTGGGALVALTGFLDDRRGLPVSLRLGAHVAAAVWALYWLGGMPPLRIGEQVIALGWGGELLALLAIVWCLNLFNFMDGIDGLAASEATFVCWSAALLGTHGLGTAAPMVIGCACLGFLWWNWPPARIFMGDVGSGYLGYVIAVLALAASRADPVAAWVWLILGCAFLVDASVTLARRLARGERVSEAHRSHAYQWLARRWGSHRRVTLTVLALNVCWLLPCAIFATRRPAYAAATAAVAVGSLAVLVLVAGGGRREAPQQARE
jgi:glycosyltransferase WbpL